MGVRDEIIVEESEEVPEKEPVKKVPPDGGYGYVIILAYGLANGIVIPVLQNFGLIYEKEFQLMQMTATNSATIINVAAAVGMGMGLFNGPLLRIYGYRKVSVASGVLFSIGIILTSWATTFAHFIITFSIIAAIGFGMSTSGFSLALNSYFVSHRNKAVGVAITITGLGPILFPQLVTFLLTHYGVQGCVVIIGAISLHIILAGLLLQPLKWHMIEAKKSDDDPPKEIELLTLKSSEPTHFRFDSKRSSVSSYHTVEGRRDSLLARIPEKKEEERWDFPSDDEEAYLEHYPFRKISLDHSSGVQNIYGFDALPPIQRSNSQLKCKDDSSVKRSATIADIQRVRNDLGSPPPSPGPLGAVPKKRWFETGSLDTVNLGSSLKIFDEKFHEPISPKKFHHHEEKIIVPREELKEEKNKITKKHLNRMVSSDSYYADLPIRTPLKITLKRYIRSIVKFFELDLLRDPIYVNIMMGMSIAVFAELNFSLLTPFILADMNFNKEEIASVMSLLAIADIIFRFIAPFVGDYFHQPARNMYIYSLLMLIVGRSCVPLAKSHSVMLGVGFFLGVAKGVRSVYMSLVLPNYVSIERLASASGLQMMTNGLLLVTIGPLMGVIRDISGSYVKCIIILNVITATTITMWVGEMLYLKYRKKSTATAEEESLNNGTHKINNYNKQ